MRRSFEKAVSCFKEKRKSGDIPLGWFEYQPDTDFNKIIKEGGYVYFKYRGKVTRVDVSLVDMIGIGENSK